MSQYGIQMGEPELDVRGIRREKQREKRRKKMDQGKRLKLLLQLILRKSEEAKKRVTPNT